MSISTTGLLLSYKRRHSLNIPAVTAQFQHLLLLCWPVCMAMIFLSGTQAISDTLVCRRTFILSRQHQPKYPSVECMVVFITEQVLKQELNKAKRLEHL